MNRILIALLITGGVLYISNQETRLQKVEAAAVKTQETVEEIRNILLESTPHKVAISKREAECLAKNIYHEAGVESEVGKIAVGQVTLNRVSTGRWGKNICDVVYSHKQFSWTLDQKKVSEKPQGQLWKASLEASRKLLLGIRVKSLEGAQFYHTDYIKTPKWADKKAVITQIDQHIFYAKALMAPTPKKAKRVKA